MISLFDDERLQELRHEYQTSRLFCSLYPALAYLERMYGELSPAQIWHEMEVFCAGRLLGSQALEMEVIDLKKQLNDYRLRIDGDNTVAIADSVQHDFNIIMAHVINNSISKPFNYITINKGELDGVKPEMGVVDQNGVVGIVNVVGSHSARIISLLNPKFRLSCKLKDSDFFGSLVWDGIDPTVAVLEELPRHVTFQKGDTIVTSGYSAVFPEGLIVGTILNDRTENRENFFSLKVKLTSDFTQLSTVKVIENKNKDEIKSLEAGEEKDNQR